MIIAVSTNKGGVLKTSMATNLAGVIASKGKKVLLVDTDNQGNVLLSFGHNPDQCKVSLFDVLVHDLPVDHAIVSVHKRIDVLPSNDDMAFFEFDVLGNPKKFPRPFQLLRHRLTEPAKGYDVVIIDTPPNLGLTQANVLSFADHVLIPFQPEQYSMRSLVKIVQAIEDFKNKQNPGLSILGVVPTLVDFRTVLHSEVIQECRKYCDQKNIRMYDTAIKKTVRYASSIAYDRLPVTLADPKSPAAQNYNELYREVFSK